MQTSSFLHKLRRAAAHLGQTIRSLVRNRFFWGGLGAFALLAFILYLFINWLVMPLYTRHDVAVQVPSVLDLSFEEAEQILAQRDLRAERDVKPFNPELPRDLIVDQSPAPGDTVKPGRRIYLTINTGEIPRTTVPQLNGFSLREAESQLVARGLKIRATRPDTVPSPHRNTITRVEPAPGTSLAKGSSVTLWYSTGPGERYVTVPDVTEMTIEDAQEMLLRRKLRSVVVGRPEDYQGLGEPLIKRQSPDPGTSMREGSEIRLILTEEDN